MNQHMLKIAQQAFQDELQTITNNTVPQLKPAKLNRNVSELPSNDGADEASSQPIGY
jgi:hypothetical protein